MTALKQWPLLGGIFLSAALLSAHAAFTNLYDFTDGVDGASPQSGLIQGANAALYGTTLNGGTNGFGAIYSVTTSGAFTPLYSFTGAADGAAPWGGLLQVSNANFFGTTISGGNGFGTIFAATATGALNPLYAFNGTTDGSTPEGNLALGPDANLYGTANLGGTNGLGSIFRITPGGTFSPLYSFTGAADGSEPATGLTLGTNGIFYGSTTAGGGSDVGTLFKMTTNGQFSLVYTFTNGYDGASPQAPLVAASDGNFYGAAFLGGSNNNGALFRLTPAGAFTALYSFSGSRGGTNADGINPNALIQASDGNLYGTAFSGGSNGGGTIFMATLGGALTPLYSFGAASTNSYTNSDGADPTGLIQAGDGNFYGTTLNGGPDSLGTIFALTGPAPLAFLAPGVQYVNGAAILRLSGLSALGNTVIDASTDLTQWTPILTNPPSTGQIQLTDTFAQSFPYRFYRARLVRP
jgi:uncharacterized repeat protein (TIGR03803 family)